MTQLDENKIDSILKLGLVTILLVAAATKQQYSYYLFVRWAVSTIAIYFTYKSTKKHQIGLTIFFVMIAILFNPFKIFSFQKATWQLIDYILSSIFLLTIYFDWKSKTKNIQ